MTDPVRAILSAESELCQDGERDFNIRTESLRLYDAKNPCASERDVQKKLEDGAGSFFWAFHKSLEGFRGIGLALSLGNHLAQPGNSCRKSPSSSCATTKLMSQKSWRATHWLSRAEGMNYKSSLRVWSIRWLMDIFHIWRLARLEVESLHFLIVSRFEDEGSREGLECPTVYHVSSLFFVCFTSAGDIILFEWRQAWPQRRSRDHLLRAREVLALLCCMPWAQKNISWSPTKIDKNKFCMSHEFDQTLRL